MQRTLSQQTPQKVGQDVSLSGWVNSRRDHGGVIFIDLRDHTRIVQLSIHPGAKEAFEAATKCRDEFVIQANGKVVERSAETKIKNIPTGEVEVVASSITIL